ncbi:MAG: hypothetical protein JSR54_03145 [Proteobacteria bacterium]|nr:hypothetical protein [Pseudomonadota bacterium]
MPSANTASIPLIALLGLLAGCAARRSVEPAPVPVAAPAERAAANTTANALASEMRSWAATRSAFFRRTWGVDIVGVRLVSSDWMLEFKFRVLDPDKAAPLLDEHAKPYLVDEASGARLAVPAMENVGELRQHTRPEANRSYFMLFGNASRIVPRGGHVTVVIGKFEAPGIPVQ